jgi:AraC-like DNA-binding protein
MTDRVKALHQAAQARHRTTLGRAQDALRALITSGEPVSFSRLAQAATVSRSWLYRQHELRTEIERYRKPGRTKTTPARQTQPATGESLRQQLHAYREEIARLRAENRALNDQLARRLGAQRAENVTRP